MNGIEIGYRYSSPLDAFIDAMVIQTILSIHNAMRSGIPTIIKHNGIRSIVYKSKDRWKLSAAFPFSFIQVDSSRLASQQIRGPRIPPKGKRKHANADKWQNIAHVRSLSDKTLISFMANFLYQRRHFLASVASIYTWQVSSNPIPEKHSGCCC